MLAGTGAGPCEYPPYHLGAYRERGRARVDAMAIAKPQGYSYADR